MAEGIRDIWSLGEPQGGPSTQEAEAFKRAFLEKLHGINQALQYTAANGEQRQHAEQIDKREKLMAVYQTVLGKYNSGDATGAKSAAEKVLSASQGTASEAAKFKALVEQGVQNWQSKQGNYDEALMMIDHMEGWGDGKTGTLRTILSKIQEQANQKQFAPAVQAMDQVVDKIKPLYEQAEKNYEFKQQYDERLQSVQPLISEVYSSSQEQTPLQQEVFGLQNQMQIAAGGNNYEQAYQNLKELEAKVSQRSSSYSSSYSQETTKSGGVTRTATVGDVGWEKSTGTGRDPRTGKVVDGVAAKGHATAYSVKKEGGPVTGEVKVGHVEGEFKYGNFYDPKTGAKFEGVKASGKAVLGEVSADTPIGKVEGSVGKVEAEGVIGYEYDPEKQVEFQGVKGKASASVFEGKIEGKYGKLEAKALGAGIESKSGIEYDKKTGKMFIGTTNKAEAYVIDESGELKTADGSFKLVGEAQILKAEATLDANMVADKYGVDFNAKAGAEANLYKVGVGGEIRMTPKALFDNTVGAIFDLEAPDYLDFGPVVGAKVSESKGVGGTLEAGGRLGIDEVNARAGGFIALGEGVGLDVKTGWRLGPLKYAVEHYDELKKDLSDAQKWAGEQVDAAEKWAGEQVDWAAEQADAAQEWAGEQVDAVQDWASEQADAAQEWAGEQVDAAKEWAEEQAKSVADTASQVYDEASKQVDAAEKWVGEKASEIGSWATEQGSAVVDTASQVYNEASSFVDEQATTAKNWASDTASDVADFASSTASDVANTAGEAKDWLADQASSTWDSIFG